MEIDFTAPSAAGSTKSASDRAKITREDFFKILTTELTHQDPLEPMNQTELLNQLTSLQSLESTAALTDGVAALMKFQGLGAASNMIGKRIFAVTDDGEVVRGVVEKVTYDAINNDVRLVVNGKEIAMANIREIQGDPTGDAVDDAVAEFDGSSGV